MHKTNATEAKSSSARMYFWDTPAATALVSIDRRWNY